MTQLHRVLRSLPHRARRRRFISAPRSTGSRLLPLMRSDSRRWPRSLRAGTGALRVCADTGCGGAGRVLGRALVLSNGTQRRVKPVAFAGAETNAGIGYVGEDVTPTCGDNLIFIPTSMINWGG